MSKVYNLAGEEISSRQVKNLFTNGVSVYMISYMLKIFQSDCLNLLETD